MVVNRYANHVLSIFNRMPQHYIHTVYCYKTFQYKRYKLNSVALVRERTIPTERPPPVGEVIANFLRIEGCHVVSATGPHGR